MMEQNKKMESKVKKYIDQLFTGVGETQQLFELKEELTINMKEKITDYQSRGMDEEQAFKEAIVSMGDLSGLVEDMRKLGQESAKQSVYNTMESRISTSGIIVGVLLIGFGFFTSAMTFFMNDIPRNAAVGSLIFAVAGAIVLTYSILVRETKTKYAMNKIRASLYAVSIGLILFGVFAAASSGLATGEMFIAISAMMIFFLVGLGLFLGLILTGTDRRKKS